MASPGQRPVLGLHHLISLGSFSLVLDCLVALCVLVYLRSWLSPPSLLYVGRRVQRGPRKEPQGCVCSRLDSVAELLVAAHLALLAAVHLRITSVGLLVAATRRIQGRGATDASASVPAIDQQVQSSADAAAPVLVSPALLEPRLRVRLIVQHAFVRLRALSPIQGSSPFMAFAKPFVRVVCCST